MFIFTLIYAIGFLCFFAWMCYNEFSSFFKENKAVLLLGILASIFWPFCLIVMIGDLLDDFVARIVARKPKRP